ncbi:hypothetical protein [Sphingosinicella terrae]|uniref:hypothetical protein n=1 Tax=Sphingosinicella terrae TaxID=2172047 RepID=UPI000E0DFDD7|nr:hypothetical protein [Sphingosinicella terrae]
MGLSSSKSKTTTNQTQTSNQATSGTQMPVTPPYLEEVARDYVSRIREFGNLDPRSFVAAPSALQQQAWNSAGSMLVPQGGGRQALDMAQQAGQSGANLAGSAATVAGTGFDPADYGQAQGYGAARTGSVPQQVQAFGYDPTLAAGVNVAPTAQVDAQNLLTDLDRYMSPYTDRVVRSALEGFDENAGQTRAQQAAQAARNGAFGGSRYAIQEAQTETGLARERAATEAGLRDRAFSVGAGLSADDANRRQQAGAFNASAENTRSLSQAGLNLQRNLANAGYSNEAAAQFMQQLFGASSANADLASRHALDFAGRTDAASQFGLAQQQQRELAAAEAGTAANRYGAENAFQAALANQQAGVRNQEFNAGQRDTAAARALQAAQLIGAITSDRSAEGRANLQALAGLGDQQRQIAQARAMAPLAQLQAMGQLSGMTPYDILVGRSTTGTTTGTGTTQGTSVTRETPSLFSQMLELGNFAKSFIQK